MTEKYEIKLTRFADGNLAVSYSEDGKLIDNPSVPTDEIGRKFLNNTIDTAIKLLPSGIERKITTKLEIN